MDTTEPARRTTTARPDGRLVWATVLWLVASMGPVLWLRTRFDVGDDFEIATDPAYIVLSLAVGGISAWFADWAALLHRRDRALAIVAVLTGALTLSAAWSLAPWLTFTHGLRLIAMVGVAAFLATRLSALEQMATAWVAVQIGCAWSAVQILRVEPGTQDSRENWVGIFVNRNLLGLVSGIGITLSALLAWHVVVRLRGRTRAVLLVMLGVAALADLRLLYGSHSATPVGVIALMAVVVAGVLVVRRLVPGGPSARVVTGLAVLGTALIVLSVTVLSQMSSLMGRSAELTRRKPLWEYVFHKIGERPLWGWGYLGGWEDVAFRKEMREYVRGPGLVSAHNSTLEVALGAGVLVTAVFVVLLVLTLRTALRTAFGPGVPSMAAALWPLVALCWFLFESLTETFFVAGTLPTLLLLTVALSPSPRVGDEPAGDVRPLDGGDAVEAASLAPQPH